MRKNCPHNTHASLQRQQQIERCLLDNMITTPYDQITVGKLCEQLEISRRTFYTYFPDKDTCRNEAVDHMIKSSMVCVPGIPAERYDLNDLVVHYLRFWKDHRYFLDAMAKQDMFPLFRDRSIKYFTEEDQILLTYLDTQEVRADADILHLCMAVRIGLLMQWHSRDFDLSVEDMAKKYIRMINSPMLHL